MGDNRYRHPEAIGVSACLLAHSYGRVEVIEAPRSQAREGSDGQVGRWALPTNIPQPLLWRGSRPCGLEIKGM